MKSGIYFAQTEEQRQSIYKLRYEIYVDEMNRYQSIADHENRRLIEKDDEHSRLLFAVEDGQLVGTGRLTWGSDAPFMRRHREQYDLDRFLKEVPQDQMIVGERFMIASAYRGTDVLFKLFCAYLAFVNEQRIQLIFGDCEPHLLNIYQKLGYRTYTEKNVNSLETGYLIPLIMVPEDIAYMETIKSPLLAVLKDFGPDSKVPESVPRLLAQDSAVLSQQLASKSKYWSHVCGALSHLDQNRFSLFDGLTKAQTQECLRKSNVIKCMKGDHVLKKGNVARNMFVVLSGMVEVRDHHALVAVLGAGDVFGEMAFLLKNPRSMDVYAAEDDVRILSLSESTIRNMVDSHPEIAAKILLNISKMLCVRILKQS